MKELGDAARETDGGDCVGPLLLRSIGLCMNEPVGELAHLRLEGCGPIVEVALGEVGIGRHHAEDG